MIFCVLTIQCMDHRFPYQKENIVKFGYACAHPRVDIGVDLGEGERGEAEVEVVTGLLHQVPHLRKLPS